MKKLLSIFFALVLLVSFGLVTAVPAGAAPVTQTVTGDGAWGFTLAQMDQQFSTDTIDASGGVTLSGSVTLGNFDAGAGDDVWYEAGLVSNETYLGYSRLHNKGVYMIALWTGTGYIAHMQNVVGQQPQNTGNYLGNEVAYTDLWGDAGKGYFQVPNAVFDYELKYHDVTASSGEVDLRISVDGGTTWSGWKLYQYAEDDMESFYVPKETYTPEQLATAGYATDDDLTGARIVSQIFVCSGTTEIFTVAYDNIQVNDNPYELAPRVKNVDTGKGYTAIQLAIDAPETDAGDTITCAAGTYDGAIVDKSVTVSGVEGGASVITSGVQYRAGNDNLQTAFRPEADGAEIRNFTIDCSEDPDLAVYARGVDNVTVDSLVINTDGAVQGITNWGGSDWVITNNVITNTVTLGGGGIGIFLGAMPPTEYSESTELRVCTGNLIQLNEIAATATAETYSCAGIAVCLDTRYEGYENLDGSEDVSGNQILDNTITSTGVNNAVGIEVGTILGDGETDPLRTDPEAIAALMAVGTVHDNVVQENSIDGAETGIYFYNVTGLAVTQNEIKNSVDKGIYAEHAHSGTVIQTNDFADNAIQVLDDAQVLDIQSVLDNNTFDRAVVVNHLGASLLHTIWSFIQDGIDAASDDDTINVAAGTYTEAILIDKPLILRGATADVNKNGYTVPAGYAWDDTVESIINHSDPDGGYTAIVDIYDTDNVTFEGFVVQELDAVANLNSSLVRVYAHTQEISNIVVRNNVIGPNTNVTSQDGTHGRMGLYIVNHPYSDQFGVIDSTFSGNKIFDCKGNGNNVFIWSSYFAYGAPGPASMSGTVIEDNEIYGSHRSGIETAGGFSGLTIRNNKIYGNSGLPSDEPDMLKYGHGILLIRGASDKLGGPTAAYGPEDLTIENNEIYDNQKSGIYMGPINKNYSITGNNIHDNGWDAIRVDLEGTYHNPTFEPTPASDWSCYNGSENIAAHFNNIYDNGAGVWVIGTPTNDFVFDATNNWWETKAGGLIKQRVSENVDYDPWIGAKTKDTKSKKTGTTDETVDAKDEADTDVLKKGKGKPTITVTEYEDNPGDGAPGGFSSAGKYIDVHLDDTTDVTEIEIRNYYTLADIAGLDEATLKLSWWNGTAWIECSDSGATLLEGDPTYRGYVWAIIKATGTTPALDDMAGTAFMSMGEPPAPPPAPGGGGGIRWPPKGTTDVRGEVSREGVFEEQVTAFSEDELCTLTIPEDTVGLTEDLEPLDKITILREDEPPEPPEEANVVLAYDLGPDGATFDPAITLTFSYDPADIPEGKDVLVVAYYDEDAEAWVYLEGEVDTVTKTITVSISHFTTFAIIARAPPPPAPPLPEPAPPPVVAPVPPAPPAPPPAPPAPVAPPPTPEVIPPFNWALLGGIIGVVVATILLIFILMRKKSTLTK